MGIKECPGGTAPPDPLPDSRTGRGPLLLTANGTDTSHHTIKDHHHHQSFLVKGVMDPTKCNNSIREKLRGNQQKKSEENGRKKGPLVVRHPSSLQLGVAEPLGSSSKEVEGCRAFHLRCSRTPSPSAVRNNQLLSPREKSGLKRSRSNVDLQRRRSPSAPRSRPSSPGSVRGPSPAGSLDNLYVEAVLKRVQKVLKARLYLLQQLGPHCFVVGGDSPENKFKVVIGPQTCTCGHGPHCVHILFVMLRVFQLPESDPRLWSKQLKNFEVESLFLRYEEQRRSRVKMSSHRKTKSSDRQLQSTNCKEEEEETTVETWKDVGDLRPYSEIRSSVDPEEGEKCVICLLEMVDGESLVNCTTGCRNKYHLHCVTIWAEYCRRQQIQLSCPLCRNLWNIPDANSSSVFPDQNSADGGCGSASPNTSSDSGISSCDAATLLQSPSDSPVDGGEGNVFDVQAHAATLLPVVESFPPLLISSSAKQLQLLTQVSVSSKSSQLLQHGFGGSVQAWSSSSSYGCVRMGHSSRNSTHVSLPRCHSVVPKEFVQKANAWAEVFGVDMVTCMFSRDWKTKVLALRRLSQEVVERLSGSATNRNQAMTISEEDIIKYCCQILSMMASNPVYKVYLACLQCLKTLLAYIPVKTEDNLARIQEHVKSVILAVLPRCCDTTKPGELSISSMIELCKGQNGELAVGQHTAYPSESGMGGVSYVLRCVFDGMSEKEPRSWQWLLGRLNLLDKMMVEFSQDFHLVLVPPQFVFGRGCVEVDAAASVVVPIASRYQRLVTVWRFALAALKVQHSNVVKQAREVLLTSVRFAATVPAVLQQVCTSAAVDPILEQRLGAWVREELGEYLRKLTTDVQSDVLRPSPLGHSCARRRPLLQQEQQPSSFSCCDNVASSSAVHPHLPSCGGISPTKDRLDHGYLSKKFVASGSDCGSLCSCHASPCSSSTSSPVATRRRFPGLNGASVAAAAKSSSSTALRSDGSAWAGGGGRCQSSKRPNYLPLPATFRDDWDKLGRAVSPPPRLAAVVKHRSPPPPHTRPDRRTNAVHPQSFGSCRRSSSASVVVPSTLNGGGRTSSRVCSERDVVVVVPTIRSTTGQRKSAGDVRPNGRLCSKKLDGILGGPVLPSLPSHGRALSSKAMLSFPRRDSLLSVALSPTTMQLPPAPPSSPEGEAVSLDSTVCKLKQDVELEEAVALATAMEYSAHHVEIPNIPGLMQYDDEQELIIHQEPDNVDEEDKPKSYAYVEGVHWQKGPILGTGAFSTCYQARDVQTGILMAMKQVSFCRNSPEEQDKVMNGIREEVALMARLNHAHIVRILGATQQRNHFNMFVEWMPGGSVSNLLDKYGAFTEPVIIGYIQQVLSGLSYLHDNQVLHRDLKGANLLVDSTGQYLRIGDFGAAARLASRSTVAGEFQGQLLGTIAFMAPEVLRGDDYGRSCDIWSVGCVLIEMASTKPPWNADDVSNHLALIYKIARAQDPPPIPECLSPATKDLALRCLEVKSEDRPPAKELLKHPVFRVSLV